MRCIGQLRLREWTQIFRDARLLSVLSVVSFGFVIWTTRLATAAWSTTHSLRFFLKVLLKSISVWFWNVLLMQRSWWLCWKSLPRRHHLAIFADTTDTTHSCTRFLGIQSNRSLELVMSGIVTDFLSHFRITVIFSSFYDLQMNIFLILTFNIRSHSWIYILQETHSLESDQRVWVAIQHFKYLDGPILFGEHSSCSPTRIGHASAEMDWMYFDYCFQNFVKYFRFTQETKRCSHGAPDLPDIVIIWDTRSGPPLFVPFHRQPAIVLHSRPYYSVYAGVWGGAIIFGF